jgi:hypothetical protein
VGELRAVVVAIAQYRVETSKYEESEDVVQNSGAREHDSHAVKCHGKPRESGKERAAEQPKCDAHNECVRRARPKSPWRTANPTHL